MQWRRHDDVIETETKSVRTTAECRLLILPDELINEIMLRLPVSSLVRCRSVCKTLRTLIYSSQFVRDHLQRSLADPTLTQPRFVYTRAAIDSSKVGVVSVQSLLGNPSTPINVVYFGKRRPNRYYCSLLGSCNGLICLHRYDVGGVNNGNSRVTLWNPCTGLASNWIKVYIDISFLLRSGFGYDHVHNKYKLFVCQGRGKTNISTNILTFGRNEWSKIQDFPYTKYTRGIGSLVSGTLNWLSCSGDSQWKIVSLDLVKETYRQYPLPDRNEDNDLVLRPSLGVLRNCLALGCDYKKTHWAVWLMKEYGVHQSWTKLTMIPHAPINHPLHTRSLEPFYIWGNDILMARLPHHQDGHSLIGLYNLNNGRLDPLPFFNLIWPRGFIIYHESLLSPSHLGLGTSSTKMLMTEANSIIS